MAGLTQSCQLPWGGGGGGVMQNLGSCPAKANSQVGKSAYNARCITALYFSVTVLTKAIFSKETTTLTKKSDKLI